MVVVLFAADHHAIADERPQPAHVRVVRSADPRERAVVAVLIEVDLFPPAIGIGAERIVDAHRLERPQLGTG